jgi:hypothetical protein
VGGVHSSALLRWDGRVRLVAALAAFCAVTRPIAAQSSELVGIVSDARNATGIQGASVELREPLRKFTTDREGRFRIRGLNVGTYELRVRSIGFDSLVARIDIRGETVDVELTLEPSSQRLRPVTITADPIRAFRLQEFEERRSRGFGRFLLESVFAENAASQVDVILISRVPGLRTRRRGGAMVLEGQRDGRSCFAQVVVNGIQVYNGTDNSTSGSRSGSAVESLFDVNSIRAEDVIGFEWHTVATTPNKYNATGAGSDGAVCGTAIFWTK